MTHLDISRGFNSFSYNFSKEDVDYIDSTTKERVIVSKLYYSLLHYYFEEYPSIALSSGTNKHDTIIRIIKKERTKGEYTLFSTLKSLRVWADYKTLNSIPLSYNLNFLFHQVNKIVN